jgi:hypothetical protein
MTFRVPAHVQFRSVDSEGVVLDGRIDQYLGLNETGAEIWQALAVGKPVAAIASDLTSTANVSLETATQDVIAFAAELVERGLLEPAPS